MSVEEWQKKIEETFGSGPFVGGNLLPIIGAEDQYGIAVANTLHGFFAVSSAFQSFYVDTLRNVEKTSVQLSQKWYWPLVFIHVSAFRIFRGAEILFLKGYPFIAYSLLREVKDRAFMLAAVTRGFISFQDAFGWNITSQPGNFTKADHRKIVAARKMADARIRKDTIGTTSGFKQDIQDDLASWNDLFHAEVHGSTLSFAVDLKQWMTAPGPLPLTNSALHPLSVAMFVNRFEEAAWMILRTLPFLQKSSAEFQEPWPTKWDVLDASLREMINGRPAKAVDFAANFTKLVETKFGFVPATTVYAEPITAAQAVPPNSA